MSEHSYAGRYDAFSPEAVQPEPASVLRYRTSPEPEAEPSRFDEWSRRLTWAILSVCLAVWAVFGFILWVPLLLRSMVHFTFSLRGASANH